MKGKIAVMNEPGSLEIKEYVLPKVEKGGMLAKILRTNVCGSEVHIWKGNDPNETSGLLGHEMVGEILELSPDVKTDHAGDSVSKGDRISSLYYLTCGKCFYCVNHQAHLCENAHNYYSKVPDKYPHFHKTFATHYYIHPQQHFFKVPDNIPNSVAASANCAISQVYFSLEKAGLRYGDNLVIQGAGGLGLNASSVAKEFGAKVIIIDGVANRLELAKRFGADHVIDMTEYDTVECREEKILELTGRRGADIAMELTGVAEAFNEGIRLLRKGGKYISIGNIAAGTITFDPGLLTRKSIQVLAISRYDPYYLYKALQFLSKHIDKYPFDEIVGDSFEFFELETALNKSASKEVTRASIVM